MADLKEFQKKLGYKFNDAGLLEEALTHSSYANEAGLAAYNERLEFLGDAVLELVTSARLYSENPNLDEGELTRARSSLVCKKSLYKWAARVGIPELLKYGKSMGKNGATPAMSADAAEAVFGAVFMDGGYEKALTVVNVFLDSQYDEKKTDLIDPKTRLQESLQKQGRNVPYYKTVERSGPEHDLRFRVQVTLDDKVLAEAWGSSIKEAEFKAAANALENPTPQTRWRTLPSFPHEPEWK